MATYVFIHGAGHDAWCWHRLEAELREHGHRTISMDLPCSDPTAGLADYAAVVLTAMEDVDEPPIVVAHSLGALTAPIVAAKRPTAGLVFVGAIVPAPGMALADLADVDADRDVPMGKGDLEMLGDGTFAFTEDCARRRLYEDCDQALADAAIAHLRPQRSMWNEVCAVDRWPDTTIRSIVCTEDKIVDRDWSIRVARDRLGIDAELIEGAHSPMLSRPAELAAMLMS